MSRKKPTPIVDTRPYSVTWPMGRRSNLTRAEALALAQQVVLEWAEVGRTIVAQVWYRDGTEVSQESV